MIKACNIASVVFVCLYLAALINLKIGGCHDGPIAEEWEKPICEKVNAIIVTTMYIVLAGVIVGTIIFGLTH